MTDIRLPSQASLMLPTLQAVAHIGGEGPYREIDDQAVVFAGLTGEQLAIEFGPDATQKGPKVLHRIAWARTLLKRIGAIASIGHGVWGITDLGRSYLDMPEAEADAALQAALPAAFAGREPSIEKLAEWLAATNAGHPHKLPVRELLIYWGVNRRWSSVNERIQDTLTEHGLRTEPDFRSGDLDQIVSLQRTVEAEMKEPTKTTTVRVKDSVVTLVIGHLTSATNGVAAVRPSDDLIKAQTIMQLNDYSQVAVMKTKHQLEGAISWESIAKARIHSPDAGLVECTDATPPVVKTDDPLLEAVPSIVDAGFVFVRDSHNVVTGIVTTADLSDQFAGLARPFLIVGEIEQWLRMSLDGAFTPEELLEHLDPDDADRDVDGAHSLTLGEIERVLETPAAWARMGWTADRAAFIERLDQVRLIRNDIMHFSPDPLADQDLKRLATFLTYLREQVPTRK